LFCLYLILLLLVLSLKIIESFDKKINIVHVVDTKRLSNAVYFDSELLFQALTFATFQSSVVDKVVSLFDQHPEYILCPLILESNVCVCSLFSSNLRGLLVVEFGLGSVSLIGAVVGVLKTLMYDAVSLIIRIGTLKRGVIRTGSRNVGAGNLTIVELSENWVSGRFPFYVKLLAMNHLVRLDNFLNNCFCLLFIHLPNLADSVIVTLFKSLVLLLKLFKHFSEVLELFSTFDVFPLELSKFLFILALDFPDDVLEASLSESKQQ